MESNTKVNHERKILRNKNTKICGARGEWYDFVTENGVQMIPAQKPIKRQGWGKGKFALFWTLATRGGWTPVQRLTSPLCPIDNLWARASVGEGRGLHAGRAQSALTIILKLIIGGLTTTILIVLNTASLQFQDWFVPISLRPVLRTVAGYILAIVWLSCS